MSCEGGFRLVRFRTTGERSRRSADGKAGPGADWPLLGGVQEKEDIAPTPFNQPPVKSSDQFTDAAGDAKSLTRV